MKSMLISLPCSLVVSLLVTDTALLILGVPVEMKIQLGVIALTTVLLYERGLAELGIIGAISLFAQANAQGSGSQVVAPHVLLSLLITLLVTPTVIRAMGIELERST